MKSVIEKTQIEGCSVVDSFGVLAHIRRNVLVNTSLLSPVLAKVPVIVLLAMNPATLNSKIPAMPETDNPNKVVMLAPETKSAEKSTYVISPEVEETQQSDAPFGWVSLKRYNIPFVMRGKTPVNEFTMVFATSTLANGDYTKITDVFLINDDDFPSVNPYYAPPRLERLYYHNTKDGKEYYGAYIAEPICNKDGVEKAFRRIEKRIDNNTAKQIINLLKGKTKWVDDTQILFYETTSPKRQETIHY